MSIATLSLKEQLAETVTFLVIGAQKSGTTWLCDMMRKNPAVFIPDWKELHFFDKEENFAKGYSWYLDFFRGSRSATAVGEGTPNYFYNVCTAKEHRDWINRDVPARVKDHLPHAKFVLSLRDPVQRAISAYNHFVLRGNLSPKIKLRDCWDERGIRSAGKYDQQMAMWLEHFNLDRFHIIIYEDDIKPDDRKLPTMNALFDYVGVPRMETVPGLFESRNPRPDAALGHLNQLGFLRENRYGRKIRDRINGALPASIQSQLEVTVDPEDVDALKAFFDPHNRAFETMIGRDLPW